MGLASWRGSRAPVRALVLVVVLAVACAGQERLFEDQQPTISHDGRHVLFVSNRPAVGRSAEQAQTNALFIVQWDGDGLACLETANVTAAAWSADGRQIAYCAAGELVVLDLATGERRRWRAEPGRQGHRTNYGSVTWLDDGRLVFTRHCVVGEPALLLLDPAEPDAITVLVERPNPLESWGGLCVDRTGRLFAALYRPDYQRRTYTLFRFERVEPGAEAVALIDPFAHGQRLRRAPDGRLLGTSRIREGRNVWIDPETGAQETALVPLVDYPDATRRIRTRRSGTVTLDLTPDGTSFVFSHDCWTQREGDARATVLWVCPVEGGPPRLLTRPDPTPVAMWSPAQDG